MGFSCALETANLVNVAVYERAGWVVHAESEALMPAGPKVWVMRLDPP